MLRLDAWCFGKDGLDDALQPAWYQDSGALRLSGLLGLGTEFVVLTLCLLLGSVSGYLFFTIIFFNAVWLGAIVYRKLLLTQRISRKISEGNN
jgi:hypothetical protein